MSKVDLEETEYNPDYAHWPQHARPPAGWVPFGVHAGGPGPMPRLELSEQVGEDGLPLWERAIQEEASCCSTD